MVQYYIKENGNLTELEEIRASAWINLRPPFASQELENFARTHNIPLDFLTDSLDVDERSRYEREENVSLILVNSPVLNDYDPDNEALYITVPIGIIITLENFITISSVENPVLKLFQEDRVKNFQPSEERKFILQIFEQIVFRYLICLKQLNAKRNSIEKELYNSSKSSDLKQMLQIEKSLVYFVNSLSANELLKMKMKRTDILKIQQDEELNDLFEDLIIDNSQALEMANVHTNILNGTMEAYASIISNNLNVVIQRLTLITIILMVPTLVASYYGMNFTNLPLANKPYGFGVIIIISIVLSLILAWVFRRKKLF